MDAESIKQELEEEAAQYNGQHLDVDEKRSFLQKRARKWAAYDFERFTDTDWRSILSKFQKQDEQQEQQKYRVTLVDYGMRLFKMEERLIWTTKPHTHQALFLVEVINEYIIKLGDEDYLLLDHFTKKGMSLLGLPEPEPYADMPAVQLPDFGSIRAIADKDKELFPDPEPIRQEAAGAIINFTSWEAALVIYTDCAYKGETLHISILNDPYLRFLDSTISSAKVVERTDGAGKSICAAIFPHIPFVTDYHRGLSQVVTRVDCRVTYWSRSDGEKPTYTETIILSRGQVHDLDWRGVLPQRELQQQLTTQPATIPATPSNIARLQGATITLKDVKHTDNECIYYLEVVDPDYIEEPYEQKWTLQLEGSTLPDTITTTSASYGVSGATAEAGYYVSPRTPQPSSRASQKPRKVIRSTFSKP